MSVCGCVLVLRAEEETGTGHASTGRVSLCRWYGVVVVHGVKLVRHCREVPDDRFVHIGGGLQFTYDVSRQPYRFNRTSGELLQPGNRVTGVTYDCGELPEGPVRVVLNSQLAEGVQDYFGLKQGDTLLTFGPLLSESLSQYLDAAAPQDGQVRCALTCHDALVVIRSVLILWARVRVEVVGAAMCIRGGSCKVRELWRQRHTAYLRQGDGGGPG